MCFVLLSIDLPCGACVCVSHRVITPIEGLEHSRLFLAHNFYHGGASARKRYRVVKFYICVDISFKGRENIP